MGAVSLIPSLYGTRSGAALLAARDFGSYGSPSRVGLSPLGS